ncbi:unnamed protein product [Dicrocoelium dendriticum]|nr:unnamed protein product [Dicrocoelium dendriticum]
MGVSVMASSFCKLVIYDKMHRDASESLQPVDWIGKLLSLACFAFGLVTFGRGFLLTRSELPYIASARNGISHEAVYRRVLFILVDGLAFEFIQPISNRYSSSIRGSLPFTSGLIRSSKAQLVHFIADPPTTTLQRLKGLMTGSMPTFVDAGSNFGSPELREDNLILQWRLAHKRILFVGDDTWLQLFPHRTLVDNLHDDDLLLILGDHGMTVSGDHGGDSVAELDAALVLYSRRGLPDRIYYMDQISQIDLVPTLATLSEVSIPFSNLGVCVESFFPTPDHFRDCLTRNFVQMMNYTLTYHHEIGFSSIEPSKLAVVESLANSHDLLTIANTLNNTEILSHLLWLQNLFRRHWTRFDMELMFLGALLLLSATTCLVNHHRSSINMGFLVAQVILTISASFTLPWTVRFLLLPSVSTLITTVLLFRSVLVLVYVDGRAASSLSLLGFLALAYTSNSFVVHEIYVIAFLIQTLLLFDIIRARFLHSTSYIPSALFPLGLASVVIRLCLHTEVCREESFKTSYCQPITDIWMAKPVSKLTPAEARQVAPWRLLVAFTALWAAIYTRKRRLRKLIDFTSWTTAARLIEALLSVCAVCLCSCWILDVMVTVWSSNARPGHASGMLFQSFRVNLSRLLLLSISLSMALLLKSPIHISSSANAESLCPRVEHHAPISHTKAGNDGTGSSWTVTSLISTPVVLDFNQRDPLYSVYCPWLGTTLVALPVLALMVFLNEIHLLSLLGVLLLILARSKTITMSASSDLDTSIRHRLRLASSWTTAVYCCLIDSLSFYATGHQPTVASIPWTAAFAAHSGAHSTNWVPAIMVLAHVYAGPILTATALPFLIVSVLPDAALHARTFDTKRDSGSDFIASDSIQHGLTSTLDLLSWRLVTCKAILTLGSVSSTAILRRHLMVWKIFFPRLMFSSFSLLVSVCVLLVVRLVVINSLRSVEHRHRRTVLPSFPN